MSSDGYDRLLELVAQNPALEAEELVDSAVEEGIDAEQAEEFLNHALAEEDVIEFGGKHWIVRKGRFAYEEYDHPV